MEGMYAEYTDMYGDIEGVVSGTGPSGMMSVDIPKQPKRNVIVDEAHPFDLEAYIASYTGQFARSNLLLLLLFYINYRSGSDQTTPIHRLEQHHSSGRCTPSCN